MTRPRVVITGLGAVTPAGIGYEPWWQAALDRVVRVGRLTRFSPELVRSRIVGQADDFHVAEFVDAKVVKQTDRSTHFALACCGMAMKDAGLEPGSHDPARIGMYFANVFGGMDFAEAELVAQTFLGPSRVSAYQAIAWFFAASQGQWSIQRGLRGYAKTIVGDRAGGVQALWLGAEAIRTGHASVVFAGGFEAPLAPYVLRIHESLGYLTTSEEPARAYLPFDREATGMVVSEGCGVIVLEELGQAVARGAPIYAELVGGAMNIDGADEQRGQGLARCVAEALSSARTPPHAIDVVMPEGTASGPADEREVQALERIFAEHGTRPALAIPKTFIGHTLAAAGALDVICAALMIHRRAILAGPELARSRFPAPWRRATSSAEVVPRTVLCQGSGFHGVNCALVVRAPEAS
jgi:3-oxoacyl-(acyl-carrier-protein) synthase